MGNIIYYAKWPNNTRPKCHINYSLFQFLYGQKCGLLVAYDIRTSSSGSYRYVFRKLSTVSDFLCFNSKWFNSRLHRRRETWIIGGINIKLPWKSAFCPDFRYHGGVFTIQFSVKICNSFLLLYYKNFLHGVIVWHLGHFCMKIITWPCPVLMSFALVNFSTLPPLIPTSMPDSRTDVTRWKSNSLVVNEEKTVQWNSETCIFKNLLEPIVVTICF